MQDVTYDLIEAVLAEARDLGDGQRGPITAAAILNGAPKPFALAHDPSCWPRAPRVDQDGISRVRCPRPAKVRSHEEAEHVRMRSGAVPDGREHPPPAAVPDHRCVARL